MYQPGFTVYISVDRRIEQCRYHACWVFIQRRFSDNVRSCDTAHGQKRAFDTDEVTQLRRLMIKKRGGGLNRQKTRQEVLRSATDRLNRTDTRCACAAHFQR